MVIHCRVFKLFPALKQLPLLTICSTNYAFRLHICNVHQLIHTLRLFSLRCSSLSRPMRFFAYRRLNLLLERALALDDTAFGLFTLT